MKKRAKKPVKKRHEKPECPHYEDNQGFCHKCGVLMNEDRAYMSGYHPNQRGMADKFDEPPEFDVAGGL